MQHRDILGQGGGILETREIVAAGLHLRRWTIGEAGMDILSVGAVTVHGVFSKVSWLPDFEKWYQDAKNPHFAKLPPQKQLWRAYF